MIRGWFLVLVACVMCGSPFAQPPAHPAASPSATPTPQDRHPKRAQQPGPGDPNHNVAVNLEAGVYHCEGSPEYEQYKGNGVMLQQEAIKKGYRAAFGQACQ